MAYIGAPPANRVLSSADIAQGSVTLDDINFTDQPTNMDITGVIDKHTMRLADGVTITGDVTISDDLVLSKISDDGNAITMTNDGSSRTITGSGSIEASTLSQTPNQSLTGMTGEIGSGVTGSPALNLSNATQFPVGHVLQTIFDTVSDTQYAVDTSGAIFNTPATTNLEVTITPSSTSNKIFLSTSYNFEFQNTEGEATVDFYRSISGGATVTYLASNSTSGQGIAELFASDHGAGNVATYHWIDSPNTTSAVTYRPSMRDISTGNCYMGPSSSNGGMIIIAQEIQG